MSYYSLGDSFRWFIARIVDIKDPEFLGRVKIRVIHDQTGELGEKTKNTGLEEEELLWAYQLSSINSASLSYKKINELEYDDGDFVPDWIDAVGLSPTGIAVGTYAFGFYLDGYEQNIPLIFSTYHKLSLYPEPGKDKQLMLQDKDPTEEYEYNDIAALARGKFKDPLGRVDGETSGPGQTLPKEPYSYNSLWTPNKKKRAPVDEFPTAYDTEYPYNLVYTTKRGHAIEIDDSKGHERIHIWHQSGSYEEISNGPTPLIDDETKNTPNTYPTKGPAGYYYITAGGITETNYTGRRSRKTTDCLFETVKKDHNLLIQRDQNVEIANTNTTKIGSTFHLTVGWDQPPKNRVNDNLKTPYDSGNIREKNFYLDVANNFTSTTSNNYVINVGVTPQVEYRLTPEDNLNMITLVANNQLTVVAGQQITTIKEQHLLSVKEDSNITVEGFQKIEAKGGLVIKSPTYIEKFGLWVEGAIGTAQGASGSFTSSDGKIVTVVAGIVTGIV